eukprot:gnl/MRDRNA2_/MRDRNA2_50889_c0_seq1.p1 gnl/MRDRNA2_/MRDRNA2_50889_c0~~gnl/MRDRNA2_/MRDRNA2_50889_c0_seq1.p1  ORF type:complete len:244 (+),score=17.87 gnl/MRDRNA2_/MRDRNA2_50889_c0_seq1:77-808(+)
MARLLEHLLLLYSCCKCAEASGVMANGEPCPPGAWIAGENKCYLHITGSFTHKDCNTECGEMATLVCINSEEENTLIMNSFNIGDPTWIGLYQSSDAGDDAKDGWNDWSNGCGSKYRNWYGNNPDDACGAKSEQCAMVGARTSPQWSDSNCGSEYGCICEYPSKIDSLYNTEIELLSYDGFCWHWFRVVTMIVLPCVVVIGVGLCCCFCKSCPLYGTCHRPKRQENPVPASSGGGQMAVRVGA